MVLYYVEMEYLIEKDVKTFVIEATLVKQKNAFSCDFTYRKSEWDQLEDSLDGEQQREHQIESAEHIGEGQRGTMKLKLYIKGRLRAFVQNNTRTGFRIFLMCTGQEASRIPE